MKNLFLSFIFCLLASTLVLAQNREIDSLLHFLTVHHQVDTIRVKALSSLSWYYRNSDSTKALFFVREAKKNSEQIHFYSGIAESYNYMGIVYRNTGNYHLAMNYFYDALKLATEHNLKIEIAYAKNNIGDLLKYLEKYRESLLFSREALQIFEKLNHQRGIGFALVRLGDVHEFLGQYDSALHYFTQSLELRKKLKDENATSTSYNRIALIYLRKKDTEKALFFYQKALKIARDNNSKQGICVVKQGLGNVYLTLKEYSKALKFAEEALQIAQEIGEKNAIKNLNELLSKIYEEIGNEKRAFFHYKQFKVYTDSLNNLEIVRKMANLQSQYEYDKKTVVMQAEQEKERNQFYWFIFSAMVALVSVSIILFLIFLSRKKVQKAYSQLEISNAQIQEKNQIIEIAYQEVKKKNKDIHDSINAALRIQNALLPLQSDLENALGKDQFFILFKPRDGVSGDFYWFAEKDNKKILTVADCTGHGVPGSLISMLGMQILDEIVNKEGILEVNLILQNLHSYLVRIIKQKYSQVKEGMDISVISLESLQGFQNLVRFNLEYAGAMNPFYFVQNNEIQDIKADKQPIGASEGERVFQKQTFEIPQNTVIYLFTDGFQDQFGGEQKRKFMTKRFRELLLSISEKPMLTQGKILTKTIEDWMETGHEQQTDDITVMGIWV